MEQILRDFMSDPRTRTLFAFIVVDLVLGVAAAMRTKTFNWLRLGDFYYTSVVPYVLGYLLIYLLTVFGLAPLLGVVMSEIAATIGVGPAVLTLTSSIAQNLVAFRTKVARGETELVRDERKVTP